MQTDDDWRENTRVRRAQRKGTKQGYRARPRKYKADKIGNKGDAGDSEEDAEDDNDDVPGNVCTS